MLLLKDAMPVTPTDRAALERPTCRQLAGSALTLAAWLAVVAPSTASAQQATAPATPAPVAGWQNGFFLQSPNGDNRLQIGSTMQLDGRFTTDDPAPIVDTFAIRKARIAFSGRVAKYFDFRIQPDFGNGQATVVDAYFDIRFSQKLRIRTGKDKTPVGHEILIGDPALLFPERALPSTLLPNRDVGIHAQGDLLGGRLSYDGGVFNGVLDGTNSTTDVDTNNGKDVAGRVVVQPFRRAGAPAGPLTGLGLAVGGSTGTQIGALPSFKTSAGQTYFSYGPALSGVPATVANGTRNRVTPAVSYYYGSFGAFAEYARSTQAVSRGGDVHDLSHHAWDVTGSYFLTGETATAAVPVPNHPFDPPAHKWGALQIVARYATLDIDDAAFDGNFAAAGASHSAQQFTVGANWYPAQYVKYYLNYEQTVFDRNAPGARPTEHVLFMRAQVAF